MSEYIDEKTGYAMEELLPLVQKLVEKYTSKESSSVTYEKAQQLMEAVIYCINQSIDSEAVMAVGQDKPPADLLYKEGYQRVLAKTRLAKDIYDGLIENFEDYGCKNYRDTIIKGMPAFFMKYDARFAPQDHLLTLDYPLMADDRQEALNLCGIDLIIFYLQCIRKEQRFLTKFEPEAIRQLLRSIQPEYEELYLDNICEPIIEGRRNSF